MTLVDTGPLVALLCQGEAYAAVCRQAIQRLPLGPLLTTWPCFTEVMYFLGRRVGFPGQAQLWTMYAAGDLQLHTPTVEEIARMAELMTIYRDTPMDLADASIVAAAEATGLRQVFTLDAHFRIYRLQDGSVLDVIP